METATVCKRYCGCPDCRGRHVLRQWVMKPVDEEGKMPEIPEDLKAYLLRESEKRVALMIAEFHAR